MPRTMALGTPSSVTSTDSRPDIVCFSHLRWHVAQGRPRQLMTHFARDRRVFFVEEPQFVAVESSLELRLVTPTLSVVELRLNAAHRDDTEGCVGAQRRLLNDFATAERVRLPILWYCTPLAQPVGTCLPASLVVYDCMEDRPAG